MAGAAGGGLGMQRRQAGGWAGDEETQRLPKKAQGTGGSPQAEGDGGERRGREADRLKNTFT